MKKLISFLAFVSTTALLHAQSLGVTIGSQINASCYNQCNGSLTAVVSGGTAPYSYLWMPGNQTTPTITNLCAGSYTCLVTDAASATASVVATVNQPGPLSATASSMPASSCSTCDGQVSANITGGVTPYSYCWNTCACNTSACTGACPGTYTLLVTDANGCTANATTTVGSASSPTVTITSTVTTTCSGSTIALSATGAMSYVWMPGSLAGSNVFVTPASTTTYTVTGTAPNGCTNTATVTITVVPAPNVSVSEIPASCNMANGSATATVTSGTPPYSYSWSPCCGTAQVNSGLTIGTYNVQVLDASGCTVTGTIAVTDSCDYVWPGDANDDAVADNTDILDIGIANGATGTTRANASLTWIGQPSALWGTTLPSGTDYKWVDCDGNGAINPTDTQAVVLNYGMTHNNRLAGPTNTLSAPSLAISFDQDSLAAGNTGTITLSLGDASNQATNVYGVAFRLNYDAAQINTSTFGMTGGANWLGTPGNDQMRIVLHPSPANGFVDVAITRLNQQNVSGFGVLGQFYFTATTALAGSGTAATVPMSITNVLVINNAGVPLAVSAVDDSIVVADSAIITHVPNETASGVKVYPNPATDMVNIQIGSELSGPGTTLTITDLSGRVVFADKTDENIFIPLNTTGMAPGVYLITINSCNGASVTKQLIISEH